MLRTFRIIINSFAFVLLIVLAYVFWSSNPLLSILFLLSSIDQYEDVYYYTYRRRLFPGWFMPFDLVFETVLMGVGAVMLLFSLVYYSYFQTWFFKSLIPLSVLIMYSAGEDVASWRSGRSYNSVLTAVRVTGHEVRERKAFVKRK